MHTPERSDEPRILPIVRRVRNRWRLRILLRGLAVVLATAFVAFGTSAWALDALRFSPAAVTGLRIGAWALVAAAFAWFLVRPLLRRVSDQQVALYLEEHEPSLEAAILGAVEVEGREGVAASPEFVRRMVDRAVERARAVEYGRRIEQRGLYRASGLLGALSLAALAFLVLGPSDLRYGAQALLVPTRDAGSVSPYAIGVEPGDTTVARGSDQFVRAELRGFDSDEVYVYTRSAPEAPWQRLSMIPGDSGRHEVLLLNLVRSTDYFVESDGVRSATHRIEVAELPYVDYMEHTYRFPDYTGLEPRVVENGGDVAALRGTVVEIVVHPTMATPGGRLLVDDEPVADLVPGPDGTLRTELTVERKALYEIELERSDGGLVAASPEYVVDVLADQPPSVRFERPGRDTPASPIEEVFLEARADDDYGVGEVLLAYSVNGAPEDTVRLFRGGSPPLTEVTAGHTLFLEEWALEPGDVVSYYAVARDNRLGGGESVASDIYFIQIRPFERAYRQAEQQPGGGGAQGGGQAGGDAALSELQRQVVAATFNLLRDRDDYAADDLQENLVSVALAQGRVREQVQTLVERMGNRGLTRAEDRFREIAARLPDAVEEMGTAEEMLRKGEIQDALGPEQRALRILQQAEETYERFVGESPPGGGGGGGGGASADDLADLFELELDKLRNQYETVQRGQREQADDQVDGLLEKLKELARRQQQELERQRRRATSQQGSAAAGSAAGGQRDLAEETEEAARQLERLARENRDPSLSETARRLREAAESMRQSAARTGSNEGSAEATNALDRLEEAQRRLRRNQTDRMQDGARRAQETAQRLAESQRRVQDAVDRLPGQTGAERQQALDDILERKEEMLRQTRELEQELDRLANEAREDNPEAERELTAAARGMRDDKLEDKIAWSRGVVQERDSAFARELEGQIGQDIEDLNERVARGASAARTGSERSSLEDALDQARDLVRGAESMQRRLADRGQPGAGEEDRAGEGREGGGQAGENQEGETRAGGDPARGDQGGGDQGGGGEQGNRQGREGGQRGGAAGTIGGPRTSGGGAVRGDPRRLSEEEIRQFRREFGERREDAEALRQRLTAEGRGVEDLDAAIRAMRELQDRQTYSDLPQIRALQEELAQALKRVEFTLRREVEGASTGRASLSGSDDVPEGFRALVEEYYRSLAREGSSGGGGG